MESEDDFLKKGNEHIILADHILTQTFPIVKDPKLLMRVIENLYKSLINIVGAILAFERRNKRIPPYQKNDDSKINMFKWKITDRYHINIQYITLLEELRDILAKHKNSPVEFSRKELFVICSDNYNLRKISVEQMKNYISTTRLFSREVTNIIHKND